MGKVTFTGGRAWRTRAFGGLTFSDGETKDVSDEAEDWLVDNHDFVRGTPAEETAPPEFAVLSESVSTLEGELEAGEHDDHLAELKREEESHDDRKTAKEAIDERRAAVAESDEGE